MDKTLGGMLIPPFFLNRNLVLSLSLCSEGLVLKICFYICDVVKRGEDIRFYVGKEFV